MQGLALIVAVAIDPDASTAVLSATPPVEVPPPQNSEPPQPAPQSKPPKRNVEAPEGARWAWAVGLDVFEASAVAPDLAPGAALTLEVARNKRAGFSPAVRIAVVQTDSGIQATTHGAALFALTAGEVAVCPFRIDVAARLLVRVCGAGFGGALYGAGHDIRHPSSAFVPWAAAGATTRFLWVASRSWGLELGRGSPGPHGPLPLFALTRPAIHVWQVPVVQEVAQPRRDSFGSVTVPVIRIAKCGDRGASRSTCHAQELAMPTRSISVLLLGAVCACGASQASLGNDGPDLFGDGGVNCTSGSDFTGCPCQQGQTKTCYTGPAATEGVAACHAGTQTCIQTNELSYAFGPCTGEVVPTASNSCVGVVVDAMAPDVDTPEGGSCSTLPNGGNSIDTLASNQPNAAMIGVDDTNVYWTNFNVGVMSVPKAGGTPVQLASVAALNSGAIDDRSVYFEAIYNGNEVVLSVPKTGGSPSIVVSLGNGPIFFGRALAVDATSVYWLAWQGSPGNGGVVMSAPKGRGGSPVTLAVTNDQLNSLAVDDTQVYWSSSTLSGATGPIVSTAVRSLPKTGGMPSTLASTSTQSEDIMVIAVDSANVYWVLNQAVMSIPKQGGAVATLASGGAVGSYVDAIAVDGASVYWATGMSNLLSVPKGGGVPLAVTSGTSEEFGLAIDCAWVYWENQDGISGHDVLTSMRRTAK